MGISDPDDQDAPEADEPGVAAGFDITFEAVAGSLTLRRIWRSVYGSDYPEEAEPFSFVTLTDLRRVAAELQVGPGRTVIDVACGSGGPGLWVARETGAALIGIDFSSVAIEQSRIRAELFDVATSARFEVGDVTAIPQADASLDAAMSIDAFWLFPDKERAAAEIARVLRPDARFVFTSWDFPSTPEGWPPQVTHHHDILHDAGLALVSYDETTDWRERQLAVYDGILAAEDELIAELGETAAGNLVIEATEFPAVLEQSRRVLAVARRR